MTAPELLQHTRQLMAERNLSLTEAFHKRAQCSWGAYWDATTALYAYADPFDGDCPKGLMFGKLLSWCATASRESQLDAVEYALEFLLNSAILDQEEVEQWLDRR